SVGLRRDARAARAVVADGAVGADRAAGLALRGAADVGRAVDRSGRLTGAGAVAQAARRVGRARARFGDADRAAVPQPAGARAVALAVPLAGRRQIGGAFVVGIGAVADAAAQAVRLA